jgi:hypothetical protein
MSFNSTIIDIYESKKESLSEEKVFDIIGSIHLSITNGELTQDEQIKLLDKLSSKCKNSNQRSYLKKAIQEIQTKSLQIALADLIKKRKASSRDLMHESGSLPMVRFSDPIPIKQSRSIDAMRILIKPLPKARHLSISTPIQSDASESLSDRDSPKTPNDDLSQVSEELSKAIQKFVNLSVKKSLKLNS